MTERQYLVTYCYIRRGWDNKSIKQLKRFIKRFTVYFTPKDIEFFHNENELAVIMFVYKSIRPT